jgi:hypothetical protein
MAVVLKLQYMAGSSNAPSRAGTFSAGSDMGQTTCRPDEASCEVSSETIVELLMCAECEIVALHSAVSSVHGNEQAALVVLDWLQVMETSEWSFWGRIPSWKDFTRAAVAKLTDRLGAVGPLHASEVSPCTISFLQSSTNLRHGHARQRTDTVPERPATRN